MPPKVKEKTVEDIKTTATNLLVTDIEYAVDNLQDYLPEITLEEFQDMVPGTPPFSENWTKEDEAAVKRKWARDPLKEAKIKTTNKKPGLWKTCARFMKCLPTEIIGPDTHLAVDIARNQTLALPGHPKAPHWPDRLCHELTVLIPHPMFLGKPKLLATAIQYTVICCTNDCRPWPLNNSSGDAFLRNFCRVIDEQQDGETPASTLHEYAKRRYYRKYPDGSPGFWSELFLAIEAAAVNCQAVDREEPVHGHSPICYRVTVADLKVLVDALDQMTHGSLTIFHPTNVISDVVQTARAPSDLPRDNDGSLPEAHEQALLYQLRRERENNRQNMDLDGDEAGQENEQDVGQALASSPQRRNPREGAAYRQAGQEEEDQDFEDVQSQVPQANANSRRNAAQPEVEHQNTDLGFKDIRARVPAPPRHIARESVSHRRDADIFEDEGSRHTSPAQPQRRGHDRVAAHAYRHGTANHPSSQRDEKRHRRNKDQEEERFSGHHASTNLSSSSRMRDQMRVDDQDTERVSQRQGRPDSRYRQPNAAEQPRHGKSAQSHQSRVPNRDGRQHANASYQEPSTQRRALQQDMSDIEEEDQDWVRRTPSRESVYNAIPSTPYHHYRGSTMGDDRSSLGGSLVPDSASAHQREATVLQDRDINAPLPPVKKMRRDTSMGIVGIKRPSFD